MDVSAAVDAHGAGGAGEDVHGSAEIGTVASLAWGCCDKANVYKLRLTAQVRRRRPRGRAARSAARLCDRRQATKRELRVEMLACHVGLLAKRWRASALPADRARRYPRKWRLVLPDDLPLREVYGIATARAAAGVGGRRLSGLARLLRALVHSDIERLRALAAATKPSPETDGRAQVHRRRGVVLDEAARLPSERADDA